ncbi:MAG: hypothetical protein MI924_26445 [Chloroflexales bacterium]|nr:hypothetical protein [Chloroflexales bacterium]
MPTEIVQQAERACEGIRTFVERAVEPFGCVGLGWLTRFVNDTARSDAATSNPQSS